MRQIIYDPLMTAAVSMKFTNLMYNLTKLPQSRVANGKSKTCRDAETGTLKSESETKKCTSD